MEAKNMPNGRTLTTPPNVESNESLDEKSKYLIFLDCKIQNYQYHSEISTEYPVTLGASGDHLV